jgi:LuxR family transcriptional regulator, activator of conjugal transfer of Ti plasmids
MPPAEDNLIQFVEQLDGAKTLDESKSAFAAALERLGVQYYTYHIVRATTAPGRLPYILGNYPERWVQHYFSEGYLDDDPVVGEALRRQLPFSWSSIVKPEDLSQRQRRLMDEARDAEISDGMTIPLLGHGVENAAVSLVAPGDAKEAADFLHHHRHLLHLMALYFHSKAGTALLEASLTAKSTRRRSILTPREREVLEWVARGKSAWEIASILEISEKSVEFHVDGVKRKLQVFNRTHAVVKAMVMGLISIS